MAAAGTLSSPDVGRKASPANGRVLTFFNCPLGQRDCTESWGKSMRNSATLGSSLTNFYFFNEYSSNTQYVSGMEPKRHKPLDDADKLIIDIQYMFTERMQESMSESSSNFEGE